MRISPAPTCEGHGPSAERGFTLIELMVVVTIIALVSAAVILTLPGGEARLRADAERFAGRVAAARDNAVLESRPMAVWVSPSAYGFARRLRGQWQPLEDKPFATTPWRDNVVADTQGQQIRITFDSTGMTDQPVAVTLYREGLRRAVTIDADGKVRIGG